MTNMKHFAAQQLTKKQMNQVKGGTDVDLSECYLVRGEETYFIYVDWNEHKEYEKQARAAGWELVC